MLDRLRSKPGADRMVAVVGDMARFDLPATLVPAAGARSAPPRAGLTAPSGPAGPGPGAAARFRLVFAAFNTLFNLPTAELQAACFRSVARHLHPDGRFAIECFVPGDAAEHGPGEQPSAHQPAARDAIELRALSVDRVVLRVSRQDAANQTVSGQHVELSEAGGVRLRPWHLRYAFPKELDDLAGGAGLELDARWSTWAGEPFDDESPQHVSVYRPALPVAGHP
jgi:hypothetical protein